MASTDSVTGAGSAAPHPPRPATTPAPAKKAGAAMRQDAFVASTAAGAVSKAATVRRAPGTPAPARAAEPQELLEAPEHAPGWVRTTWNMFFGNAENKLFQIKLNLIHFKDLLMGLMTALQTGPLQPLFHLVDKVGAGLSGGLSRFQTAAAAETTVLGRVAGFLSRAASPVAKVARVAFKWLERSAPVFAWLTAVQDLYRATGFQGDKGSSTTRKALGWTTFALSTIGATASTVAAWTATGAAATVATGVGPVTLGTIAIVCFGLSLFTNWLAGRMTGQPNV